MPSKAQYAKRQAQGLCTECGVVSAREGKTQCVACAEAHAKASVLRFRDRKAQGLCKSCTDPAAPGKARCAACASAHAKASALRFRDRKVQGLCVSCTDPAAPGKARCVACAEAVNARVRVNYASGGACYRAQMRSNSRRTIKIFGLDLDDYPKFKLLKDQEVSDGGPR